MSATPLVAVVGGTGMNAWPGLVVREHLDAATPWGAPSAPIAKGSVHGVEALFLARHGEGHKLPPHAINYRANLAALHAAGAKAIVAIAAVGAIAEWFEPGEVTLPHDFVDYTWGRAHTFSDGSEGSRLHHVELERPYHPGLREALDTAAVEAGVKLWPRGVMAVTQGPRLETPAEVKRLRSDGCDLIGMTGMPEVALAAELGIPYACLAVSVNWAAGLSPAGKGIHDEIHASIEAGMAKVRAILERGLPRIVAGLAAG